MGSSRYDPANELLRLHDRMNRLFGMMRSPEMDEDQLISGNWTPACDIIETRDAVILRAELPGVREKDIDISVVNSLLTLRGQRNLEQEDEERKYHRIERAYGSFVRSFTLPRSVDSENISAQYRDGVLDVRMPKREEPASRHIRIDVDGTENQ